MQRSTIQRLVGVLVAAGAVCLLTVGVALAEGTWADEILNAVGFYQASYPTSNFEPYLQKLALVRDAIVRGDQRTAGVEIGAFFRMLRTRAHGINGVAADELFNFSLMVTQIEEYRTSVPSDQPGQAGSRRHRDLTGVVSKIQSGIFFANPKVGLRPRAFGIKKAERMGLTELKLGDPVGWAVDEGNVVVDVHKPGLPVAGHRIVAGSLNYEAPFWEEIKLLTPDGIQTFEVDTYSAGSKLGIIQEGTPVSVELDEDNRVIDIHRTR